MVYLFKGALGGLAGDRPSPWAWRGVSAPPPPQGTDCRVSAAALLGGFQIQKTPYYNISRFLWFTITELGVRSINSGI